MTATPRTEQVLKVMRAHPDRTAWSNRQLVEATGLDSDAMSHVLSALAKRGTLVRTGRAYSLSAAALTPDSSSPRQHIVKPALPAGPCPQSDALLRLMRGTGGAKTCRQWAAIWAERDSATQQMLDKLVDRGLIGHLNGMYRA